MNNSPSSAPAGAAGAAPGERLRAARERAGFSVQKVAEDLHLDPWIIEALEAGRIDSLGAPVYVRGHLRKYATLLGLDGDALVTEYAGEAVQEPPLMRIEPAVRPPIRIRIPWRAIAIAALAALVTTVVAWWWFRYEAATPAPAVQPTQVRPAETSTPPAATPTTTPAVEGKPGPAPAAAPKPGTSTAAAAKPTAGTVRLRLSFETDCWVEIYDATGRRLFFDLGVANTVRSITAVAPVRVFLGKADAVKLELNGAPLAVPESVRKGERAHFTVDAARRMERAGP